MRHVIDAGTDAGSLLLFDPAALPADFERRFQHDTVEILERLADEGAVIWINTDADGGYLLHLFVDEPVSPEVLARAVETEEIGEFRIPSGRLFFVGSEYAFREDDGFLRKHPHMGGSVTIRPGLYHATLHRSEFPKDDVKSRSVVGHRGGSTWSGIA